MNEEKYYTPQLEEFGIGFEFEYQNKQGRWVKMKMDRLDFRVEQTMTLQYSLTLHKERFRVKYLDEDDIKEATDNYFHVAHIEPGIYCILPVRADNNNFFRGKIKNKSVLINIVKALEI
jgi:regulation of enolase protein 1 (concanavalin A-like superfamily)